MIKQKRCIFKSRSVHSLSLMLMLFAMLYEDAWFSYLLFEKTHSATFSVVSLTPEIFGSAEPDLSLPSFPTINLSIHLIVFLSTVLSLFFPTIMCLLPMLSICPSLRCSSSIALHVNPSSLSNCQSLLSLHLSFLEAF